MCMLPPKHRQPHLILGQLVLDGLPYMGAKVQDGPHAGLQSFKGRTPHAQCTVRPRPRRRGVHVPLRIPWRKYLPSPDFTKTERLTLYSG
jgi:hypothetical protein